MNMAVIEALLSSEEAQPRILSPAVGIYYAQPRSGAVVSAGDVVGRLRVMNTAFDLVLPAGVGGRVVIDGERDKVIPVEYGQELLSLKPQQAFQDGEAEETVAAAAAFETPGTDEGFVITAFTTGIFYQKPSPEAPAYVTEGQQIEKGNILGLIEVMKTFNHIVFHGTDEADTGTVRKIYAADAQEVKLGEPLFLIS
jgi:acetyl-CoA carboxylase biotin carboxyl carrier protein